MDSVNLNINTPFTKRELGSIQHNLAEHTISLGPWFKVMTFYFQS